MRVLRKLDSNTENVLDACIDAIKDVSVKNRFTAARPEIVKEFIHYEDSAKTNTLYNMKASKWGKPKQIVCGDVCKDELMQLYSTYMVNSSTLSRKYYEKLMMLAPLSKCPYCGFGQVTTLDHFLTKARYPSVSTLTSNLIPSCFDCNKGKENQVITRKNQALHPYFSENKIEKTAWLFVRIIEEIPVSVEYFVKPPQDWSEEIKDSLINHFDGFDLGRRFGIEAATELSNLIDTLSELENEVERKDHLARVAKRERKNRPNTWEAALHEGLSLSDWYVSGGYRLCLDTSQLT